MSTLNFILGFHTYLEDYKEVKRIAGEFGIDSIVLSDPSENLDSGLTGEYKLYYGGTPIKDIHRAKFSSATVCFQKILNGEDKGVYRKGLETTHLCGKTLWYTGHR